MGSGLEFVDYWDYSFGDDFRYLDWIVYVCMEKMFFWFYEEEEDFMIYLFLDVSWFMLFGIGDISKFEVVVCIIVVLVYIGLVNLDWVLIVLFGMDLMECMLFMWGKN